MIEVEEKKKATALLIEEVNIQKTEANEQQVLANEEEKITMKIAAEANKVKQEAEEAYLKAKPLLENSQKALNRISESKISIMKNLNNPPDMVTLTGKVLIFIFKGEKVDLFGDKDNESAWKKAQKVMNNVKRFL